MTELLKVEDSYAIASAESMALRLARLDHERDVLSSSIPLDQSTDVSPAVQRIQWLEMNPAVKARLDMMDLERRELSRGLEPPAFELGLSR